jgi:hypothetical protein
MRPHRAKISAAVTALAIAIIAEPAWASDSMERCKVCERRVTVPFVRIALVETGMHAAAGALWPEGYSPVMVDRNQRQFEKSWTNPPELHFKANIFESDNDWWTLNVFAHGLFGSEAYLAARGWRHGPLVSVLFAVLASFTWEYLIESWYKPPSAIDLFWTPLFGTLLGELRYQAYLAVTRKISKKGLKKALQILLDPLGSMERRILACELL